MVWKVLVVQLTLKCLGFIDHYKDTHTNDNIELRVCASNYREHEEAPLDIIELYIK